MNPLQARQSGDVPAATRRAIQRVVRGAVPRLADFSLVFISGHVVATCVACAHATRDGARLVRTLARRHQINHADQVSSVAQVIRTGRPVLRTSITLDRQLALHHTHTTEIAELHRQLAPRSALVVPIRGTTTIVGALSLCYSESRRKYRQRDILAATQVAGEIGRLLSEPLVRDGTLRLRPAARDARQGTTLRRRVATRN